jgi:hypothetical protein
MAAPGQRGRPLSEGPRFGPSMPVGVQLDKRGKRCSRWTECHRRAHASVEHPRRQHRTGSVRYLEHGNVFSPTVLAIRDSYLGAELRMLFR